jgi:hypothetical protein
VIKAKLTDLLNRFLVQTVFSRDANGDSVLLGRQVPLLGLALATHGVLPFGPGWLAPL